MAAHLLAYDLNKPDQHYQKLYDKIGSFDDALRIQRSTWIVVSNKSSEIIALEFKGLIDKDDKLFVNRIVEYSFYDYDNGPEIKAFLDRNL